MHFPGLKALLLQVLLPTPLLVSAYLPIPVSDKGCTRDTFNPRDAMYAAQAVMNHFGTDEWSNITVRHKDIYAETVGSAVFFVCNCRGCHGSPFPSDENHEVLRIIIEEDCGPGQGGWVFSRQWNKGWGLRSSALMGGPDTGMKYFCPARCISETFEGGLRCEFM